MPLHRSSLPTLAATALLTVIWAAGPAAAADTHDPHAAQRANRTLHLEKGVLTS